MNVRLTLPPMSEKELLSNVRQLAKALGYLCYHTYRSDKSEAGFPDCILVRHTRCLAWELKTEKERVSDAQSEWLNALETAGVEVRIIRPSDWHNGTVEKLLKRVQ